MIRLVKNILLKKSVFNGIFAVFFCIVFSGYLNAKENLVTSTGIKVTSKSGIDARWGPYIQIYLTALDLKVEEKKLG